MRKSKALLLATFLVFSGALLIASCMGEPPADPSLHYLLREGRRSLEAGDAGEAYNFFLQARRIAPDNADAIWGTILSNDLLIFRNIGGIVDLLTGVYVKEPSREECGQACGRIAQCDLFDEMRTNRYDCIADCPFRLQPYMFNNILTANSCDDIYYSAAEWVIGTSQQDCRRLCESLDRCGNIDTRWTYDVDECTENCPYMYVVRHSKCYLNRAEFECHRFDRTCFEHTVLGIQIILDKIGRNRIEEQMNFTQYMLDRPDSPQYYLRFYKWDMTQPEFAINLPGRFDTSELYLSRALMQFWDFFNHLIVSQNLDINTVTFDRYTWKGSYCQLVLRDFLSAMNNTLYDPIFPKAGTLKFDENSEDGYAKAVGDMSAAGRALGRMFRDFAFMVEAMLGDTDNQAGRSLHYDDDNNNFRWDDDETWTVWDTGLVLTKQQTLELLRFFRAMRDNFLYDEPVELEVFKPVFDALDLAEGNIVIALLELSGRTTLNPSWAFQNATPAGIRPAFVQMVEFLQDIKDNADKLPAFLECTDLDI
ncbi:MAG: hypothetical protein M5R36_20250 [Deltaproteobacteria bacterium]|nr:hypothetical protein [Deltaproteobacteria bacterium]